MTSRADSAAELTSVSPQGFRDALARWASGVTIVTARGRDDEPVGMTAASFSSLSLDPPLVLVCVGRIAQSHDPLVEAPGFAVHMLGEDQADMAELFAIPGADKFGEFPDERGLFDAPLVPFDVARLMVAHHAAFDGGDHTILVGRVVAAELAGTDPLIHFHRGYRRLA
jgi:flavin reductase (DIM6/NTAB) family NADH-FMN oxidoreductase RutF